MAERLKEIQSNRGTIRNRCLCSGILSHRLTALMKCARLRTSDLGKALLGTIFSIFCNSLHASNTNLTALCYW